MGKKGKIHGEYVEVNMNNPDYTARSYTNTYLFTVCSGGDLRFTMEFQTLKEEERTHNRYHYSVRHEKMVGINSICMQHRVGVNQ